MHGGRDQVPDPPTISSTFLVAFTNVCITWCPTSTYGREILVNAIRGADNTKNDNANRGGRKMPPHGADEAASNNVTGEYSPTSGPNRKHHHHQQQKQQQYSHHQQFQAEPVLTHSVKDWHRMQEAVISRMRGGSRHSSMNPYNNHGGGGGGRTFGIEMSPTGDALSPSSSNTNTNTTNTVRDPVPTTAQFASLVLSTLCLAYLPDTTAVLSEVDAIDAMMSLIVPEHESDQADALRRVLVLRRRLAISRRLLYQKMRLLEELQRPAMRTTAGFMSDYGGGANNGLSTSSGGIGAGSPTYYSPNQQWPSGGGGGGGIAPRDACYFSPLESFSPTSNGTVAGMGHSGDGCINSNNARPSGTFAGTRVSMEKALQQLDDARTILGNTTLIYSSAVTSRNFKASNDTDFFQLAIQYLVLIVLPLTIVVSLWGMNCQVPWKGEESLKAFYGIVAVLFFISILGLIRPMYAYKSGKPELMM